jgi:hypothetical protein
MINLKKIIQILLNEASPKTSVRSRLENAIKNRLPVSFYYNGPSGEVLPGRRIKVELVASGLTKKGNLAVRGYVQPPSTSKKGFQKHGWRTFLVDRIASGSLTIYEDEQFNEKRPKYKEGDDSSFSVTYVKSNWGTQKEPKTDLPTPQEPEKRPEEPKTDELPQPKKKEKPSSIPITYDRGVEVFDNLKTKVNTINNQEQISPEDFKTSINDLYSKKIEDWKKYQKEIGANTSPGEGTRRKFERESEVELFNILKQNNIKIIEPEETNLEDENNLQEEIKRIKTLIYLQN